MGNEQERSRPVLSSESSKGISDLGSSVSFFRSRYYKLKKEKNELLEHLQLMEEEIKKLKGGEVKNVFSEEEEKEKEEDEHEHEYDPFGRLTRYFFHYKEIEEKYSNHPFRNEFFIGLNQRIDDKIFFDNGREANQLEELESAMADPFFDTTVSDPQNDKVLNRFLKNMKEKYNAIIPSNETTREALEEKILGLSRHFISEVIQFFGGLDLPTKNPQRCEETIRRLKKERNSNIIYLGDVKGCGGSRHRVILFKLLCDMFNIPCRVVRGWLVFFSGSGGPHVWNEVVLRKQFFVVDTCNFVDFVSSFKKFGDGNFMSYKNLGHPQRSLVMERRCVENVRKLFLRKDFGRGEHLGQGAFGVVYEIFDVEVVESSRKGYKSRIVRKNLAVKEYNLGELCLFAKEVEKERMERIIRKELDILSMLQHPNIVKVYGSFSTTVKNRTVVRLLMERYDMNSYQFLEIADKCDSHEILILLLEVATGLSYIHSLGIIHFDIKPQNILLNWNDEKKCISNVVISDFGSSKVEKINLILTSSPVVTKRFSAPEILEVIHKMGLGEEIDSSFVFTTKSDIYSFGVLMGFFLKYLRNYSNLESIQMQCLSKDPEDRPSITAIKWELDRCLKIRLNDYKYKDGEFTNIESIGNFTKTDQMSISTNSVKMSQPYFHNIPVEYVCPITKELMKEPVVCCDGNTFEKEAIMRWLKFKKTSPMTGLILTEANFFPNKALESLIVKFKKKRKRSD